MVIGKVYITSATLTQMWLRLINKEPSSGSLLCREFLPVLSVEDNSQCETNIAVM